MTANNSIFADAIRRHNETVEKTAKALMPEIERGGEILLDAAKSGKKLLVCGNGGSAADSQHFATEWICRYKKERGPLPAIALTVDTSALTAVGNDYGFEHVFRRQVEALGR